MSLAENSVRLDPRSSFAFSIRVLHARDGRKSRGRHGRRQKSGRAQSRTTWARAAFSDYVISSSASISRPSSCFPPPCSAATAIPDIKWTALNAFGHYLLKQYDASLSWAREALYLNPNHLQVLSVRAAALAQLGRSEEAAKATEGSFQQFPDLTVERHLRNFRWKNPADIAHYREGLLKAGVPLTKSSLVGSNLHSKQIAERVGSNGSTPPHLPAYN